VIDRRRFLAGGLAAAAACRRGVGRGPAGPPHPALGVQSGDVTDAAAAIWCRATAPGRLVVEWTTGDGFASARRIDGPRVAAASDLCGVVDLGGLPPGARVHYRCYLRGDGGAAGEAVEGAFTTAPRERAATTIVWSGDVCGQGWGRNPDDGGYRIFDAMAAARPDLFICSGDLIYADDPLLPEVKLADGRRWRNVMTPAKARVAEELDDFRGNFAYNLGDAALQRFAAAVPIVAQWDDHEVRNNWFPAGDTEGDPRYRRRRGESELAALARQAMFEYVPFGAAARLARRVHRVIRRGPMVDVFVLDARSFRASNGAGDEPRPGPSTACLGDAQLAWLEQELVASRAQWKIIASDMPLGLVVRDGAAIEAFAQGIPSPPRGREHEIARLLRTLHERAVANVVFVTADVHYAAAHLYHPDAGQAGPFTPFHELVAGPLHAGGFGPNPLDPTFGPTVLFQRASPAPNPAPWDGYCSYGRLAIDEAGLLTASWHGTDGAPWHTLTIEPAGG
jgi:alkaline phosphatase D